MSKDLEFLQGVWAIESLEMDGQRVPPPALAEARVTVEKDRFTTTGMGAAYTGRIELSPGKTPKGFVLHFDSGPEGGNANHGIYEIDGDAWWLCLATMGGSAPKAFQTAAETGIALERLVRAQPVSHVAPAGVQPDDREPVAELQGEWEMISCIRSGAPLPAKFAKSGRRSIRGGESVLRFGTYEHHRGMLSRDAGAANAIRLEVTAGEGAGGTQLGIFAFDGANLRTCMAPAGKDRPSGFSSSKEGGETLALWKRTG